MKTILITGASAGIGRATALALASLGHHIIGIGRNEQRLTALKNACQNIETISADVATEAGRADIKSFVGKAKIDILINNAGLMTPSGNLTEIDVKAWRYQMSVNVEAPLFLTTQLLENLRHGRVLNLTIYSSLKVNPGLAAYGISKAALNMLTAYMRNDLQPYSITVGLVLPGIVDTDIQKQLPTTGNLAISGAQLAKEGKLLAPSVVAKFLTWVLLETSNEQFSTQTYDIYDKWHQPYWSGEQIIAKP